MLRERAEKKTENGYEQICETRDVQFCIEEDSPCR